MGTPLEMEVTNIATLLDAARAGHSRLGRRNIWYRGHADETWNLVPS
ncbi:hypothetical protein LCGC14_2601640, partial [marine sediment metagenome]